MLREYAYDTEEMLRVIEEQRKCEKCSGQLWFWVKIKENGTMGRYPCPKCLHGVAERRDG